jgi:hypothetical protein
MRFLLFACCALFTGCAALAPDPVRVEGFAAHGPASFTYSAHTDAVMTENDDGAAERLRRDWLAAALSAHGMCGSGYVVDTRHFVRDSNGAFANGGNIVYTGRCLRQ